MPNATVRANARVLPIDRRAALGSLIGAGAMFASPANAALGDATQPLAALIAEHEKALQAWRRTGDEIEAAEIDVEARTIDIAGCVLTLMNGKDYIARFVVGHFDRLAEAARSIAEAAPDAGAAALAELQRAQDAALARVAEAFATVDAAETRGDAACDAEEAALEALCAYRCGSTAELAAKFRYLSGYRQILSEAQVDAMFSSLLPDGEV